MKAFTDLTQSKALAKILPIESADMYHSKTAMYPRPITQEEISLAKTLYGAFDMHYLNIYERTPCWSLSALLDVIPKEVEIKGQRYAPCLFPISNGYWIYKLWYNSNEIIHSPISIYCDNLIDACYEMILKLHELKVL